MYTSNTALMKHYIPPIIGNMKLNELTPRVLERYYLQLLKTPAVHKVTQRKASTEKTFVAPPTVRKVHNLLRSCFHQAVKWELMEKNPAIYATVPKVETKKRDIWDATTLFHAIEVCEDGRLKLAMNLAFACSLRIKPKLNGGDSKSVQGDSGHTQAQMVTDQYSHILDDNRMHNADLFEQAFSLEGAFLHSQTGIPHRRRTVWLLYF